jgi:uncharacterized membrane protein YdbT with pleckstrin-like domain
MPTEAPLWNGSPSQWTNFPKFVLWGLFFWLVIPLFVILWIWLVTQSTKYELTTERLRTRHGIFNKQLDELELYRVRDYKLDQPFFLRLFGLANITLQTADKSTPIVVIRAIRDGEQVREQIRNAVEECRVTKRVREVDLD